MNKCPWLNSGRCVLAEQIVRDISGRTMPIISPAGACETCQSRHTAPAIDAPGTVVASLACQSRDDAVLLAMKPHFKVERPSRLLSITLPAEGVGTEVSRILKSLGISAESCGGCRELIAAMNARGVAWCETHRAEILTRLRERAAAASWWTTRKAELLAISTGLFAEVDWLDPAPGILEKALRIVSEPEAAPPGN